MQDFRVAPSSTLLPSHGSAPPHDRPSADLHDKAGVEPSHVEAALAAARQQLETQLEDLRQLHEMNSRLSASLDLKSMLQEVLKAALSVHHTDMGLLSLCTADAAGLKPAVSAGLSAEFLRCVEFVRSGDGACGAALASRRRAIVEDVDFDPTFASYREAARIAGFRAVHSTPLITRQDKIIGTLSVYFRQPHRPSERETRLLDLYAQQAADLIETVRLREHLSAELQERRAAENALRASERRLRVAVAMARLSVYDWDPETGALNWDSQLKAMWGLPPDAFVDYDVFLRGLHPSDRAHVEAQVAQAIDPAGDGIYEAEFRVIGITDGVERWVLVRGQTTFENGRPVGFVGGAMETTDRKRAEERLENKVAERTAQLAASNARLEDYVYTIAHDLRAPLRSMQSFAGLLLEDYVSHLDETAQGYARRVVRAAETLDAMVVDLLAYGRVMRAEMALSEVNLADAWAAAMGQHEHAIRERGARLQVAAAASTTIVRAHEATLVQVLANLLSNALKFVEPNVPPLIRVRVENRPTTVRVWVEDNGIGIAPEYHDKIFRVFERLHGKTYSGTGIGLAIVRTGVERMGGRVGLESAVGSGTRFWIELPKPELSSEA